ncbi:MFS transporter (plasmid) [Streptomyces sp. HUAS TT3]|uniref:MFS transporter n=1 Tax=Streptomyces sp. HUAS TT3 TaxID=3447510 RepID=UPI003F657769
MPHLAEEPDASAGGRAVETGAGVLAALAAAQFVVVLSTSVVNVALPHIRDGVALSDTGMSWVVNAYGLAFGALLLLGGRAADLAGARRALTAGLGLFAAASVAAGLAGTPWLLIGARVVQGVGAAAAAPAALALVIRLFPPGGGRARALGVWGAVSGAGGAAGVLLGGVLTEAFGWPWIFHTCGLGAALALTATLRLVPADPGRRSADPGRRSVPADPGRRPGAAAGPARIDLLGGLSVTAAVAALVYGLTAVRSSGPADPYVLGPLAAAVLLLLLFLRTEQRHPAPLLPPGLLRQGLVAPANLLMALLGAVWVGLFFYLPLLQQQVLGAGPLAAGLAQVPLAAANMLGSSVAPRLARLLGPYRTLAAGLLAQAVGLAWLALLSAPGTGLAGLTGPTALIGLGLGIAFVQLTGAAVSGVRPADAGVAGGLVNTTRQLGGAVGLALLGTLATAVTAGAPAEGPAALADGYRAAFLLAAATAAAAAAATPLLSRRAPAPDPTTAGTTGEVTEDDTTEGAHHR